MIKEIGNVIFAINGSDFSFGKDDNSRINATIKDFQIDAKKLHTNGLKNIIATASTKISELNLQNTTSDSLNTNLTMHRFALNIKNVVSEGEKFSIEDISTDKFALDFNNNIDKNKELAMNMKEMYLEMIMGMLE